MTQQFRLTIKLLAAERHFEDVDGGRFERCARLEICEHLIEAHIRLVENVEERRWFDL